MTFISYLCFQSALVKIFIWNVMKLTVIDTSLLTRAIAVASTKCRLGVKFTRGISASIYVLFCHFFKSFLIPCYKRDSKCVLWHCSDQRHFGLWHAYVPVFVYGSCKVSYQGTNLRASDLHNALAPILNPVNRFDYAQYISYTSWS